jgi:ribosomal protein L9
LYVRKTKRVKGGKKLKRLILIGLVLFSIVSLVIFFLLYQDREKVEVPKEKLTIGLYTTDKKINKDTEITINVRIENNNLNSYIRTYDFPCESLWVLEWKKDGKPFEKISEDCKITKKEKITIKPNEKSQYSINKLLKQPGKYELTLKVFDQKVTKLIEVKK